MIRKENRKYYFSVEGDTEKWYLEKLQNLINEENMSVYKVKFDIKVTGDPIARVKNMNIIAQTEITHIFDYESDEECHRVRFKATIDRMRSAQKNGKKIKYYLGYSNFTFELWMILHKMECNSSYNNRRQYITCINNAFGEKFADLREYKHRENFNKILNKVSLNDVVQAVNRAKRIMERNRENYPNPVKYQGYTYYRENPSLSIWESIEKILKECNLIHYC